MGTFSQSRDKTNDLYCPPSLEMLPFSIMKPMAYCTYREDEFVVAQCLNVDISSFGATREEAIANLKEAVELYFEGESNDTYTLVTDVAVGQEMVNA
jgi:predicted RNase H-like HicB family nuclease